MASSNTFRGSQNFVWDTSKTPLGQGATSIVYMGRNKKTGEEVAIKVFNSMSYQRPFAVQMREFDVMQKLNHENIVKLLAVEEEVPSKSKVIIMEYCTHGSLYNLLDNPENNNGLTEEEFINVLQQVSAGVKHLRDNDIVHRDIKPGNILRSLLDNGRSVYKLTDFGAARELQQDEEFLSLYGTDEYLHPDMYERAILRKSKGKHFGVYVDLWSLGVTFFHAATGNLPFRPYGGRRNKETMHLITANKEHGVISGVQTKEQGPIEWSRDLPPTCRLSRGLRTLITSFLSVLLERDQEKIISFDEFFDRVNDITSRVQYHIFWPQAFAHLTIYARQQDDISQLRQLITDQTEILGGAQLMLHGGKVLQCDSREPVSKSLQTSKENPIYIFNRLPEFRPFRKAAVGSFPDIPPETMVDADYPLSKKCLAALYSVRNAVRVIMLGNQLMNAAVKMYCDYVNKICSDLELNMSHVITSCSHAKMYKDQLFAHIHTQVNMYGCLAQSNLKPVDLDVNSRANTLQTIHQTGNRECTQISNKMQEELEKAEEIMRDLKKGRPVDGDWKPSEGCLPSDRCIEKLDVLCQRMAKIVSAFREDRSKRHLTNNDEQIHRVDKNKLKELCITAQTLLDDHCVRRAQSLYTNFKLFYSKGVQIHDTATRLEVTLSDISHQQTRLIDKLKASGKQCINQADSCLKALGTKDVKPVSSSVDKTVSQDNSNVLATDGSRVTATDSSKVTATGGSWVSTSSVSARQDRLHGVMNSINSTAVSLLEVNNLLKENSSLIEDINGELVDMEDDDTWEHISRGGLVSS